MNFKKVFISELSPAKYNPRKDLVSSDPEYQRIKRSIEEFGYVDPIIINSDYTVIGGHQRLKVLKEMGKAQIDVVVVDIPKDKEKALNIALNKITGEWDTQRLTDLLGELKADGMDISITGFDEKEFAGLLRELHKDDEPLDAEPQISRAEELRKEWGTEVGQLWQCGDHQVICGDCTDKAVVERVMQGEKADACITDPPYGTASKSKVQKRGDQIKTFDISWDKTAPLEWIPACMNILKDGAAIISFWENAGVTKLWGALELNGANPLQTFYWIKTTVPQPRQNFCSNTESSVFARKLGKVISWNGGGATPNYFETPRSAGKERTCHETQKPLSLFVHLIGLISNSDQVVIDPFLGSGTTMIACENLGRKCRGCEISPEYVAVILQRYKDTFKKEPVLMKED